MNAETMDLGSAQSPVSLEPHSSTTSTVVTKMDNARQEKGSIDMLENDLAEKNAEIKRLQFDLDMERGHIKILKHDNERLRRAAVELQQTAEQEEEFISNTLLKKIHGLKKEKGELILQAEREEEYLTNMLQRRLEKLQQEKVEIENALEQEQEAIVNKLHRQMEAMVLGSSSTSATPVPMTSSGYMFRGSEPASPGLIPSPGSFSSNPATKWRPSHGQQNGGSDFAKETFVEVLKSEVHSLRIRNAELERELITTWNQASAYRKELIELRKKLGINADDLVAHANADEHAMALGALRYGSPLPRTRSMSTTGGGGVRSDSISSFFRARSASGSSSSAPSEPQTPYASQTLVNPVPPRNRRTSNPLLPLKSSLS